MLAVNSSRHPTFRVEAATILANADAMHDLLLWSFGRSILAHLPTHRLHTPTAALFRSTCRDNIIYAQQQRRALHLSAA